MVRKQARKPSGCDGRRDATPSSSLTIGGLAHACGVGVETVRYYQRRGLVAVPSRGLPGASSGVRRYGEDDLHRLRFIRQAQAAGFTLDEIGRLLALDANSDRAAARALADERIAALDARIAELEAVRHALRTLSRECAATSSGPCPILAAFDRAPARRDGR